MPWPVCAETHTTDCRPAATVATYADATTLLPDITVAPTITPTITPLPEDNIHSVFVHIHGHNYRISPYIGLNMVLNA